MGCRRQLDGGCHDDGAVFDHCTDDPHASYLKEGWPMIQKLLKPGSTIVLDVKGALPSATKPTDLISWSL